jgi:hypothetical protein
MRVPGFYIGPLPVAVCAADFALSYLSLQPVQRYVSRGRSAYVELLLAPDMVELQHNNVSLPTVYAGVHLQVVQYECPDQRTVAPHTITGLLPLTLSIGGIVLASAHARLFLGLIPFCHKPEMYQKNIKK